MPPSWFNFIPLHVDFGNREMWRSLDLFRICGVSRDQGDASCSTPLNRVWILWGPILITMEDYSDSDTSSESEYRSSQGSIVGSDCDENEPSQDLEPEPSEFYDEYESAPWNPEAQLQAQLHTVQLAQLYAEIKARAQLPDPTYKKLPRSWPTLPFDVQILSDYVQHPIHYFELF
jgi:hypothetical protein